MNLIEQKRALSCAVKAAQAVGASMRKNLALGKKVNFASQHDIKLELDVRSQRLIVKRLRAAFPDVAVLGEEGCSGDPDAEARWVVDPIDGTVNFTLTFDTPAFRLPCKRRGPRPDSDYLTVAGVVS